MTISTENSVISAYCDQAENKCRKFTQVSPVTNKNRQGKKMSRETGILKQNTTFFS